ncbi:MAG TPA: FixH family protein [Ktedonobacteraceae bacterium]|nr:FixH family protein [Ktedonobacteraceae bacterium]
MRRNVLVVICGLAFLVLMTWLGSVAVDIIPRPATAQVQTAQAGSYQITVQVNPNPPLITQPTALSIRILMRSTQQPVTNAHVSLQSVMETMDMGTDHANAAMQSDGSYLAHVQFTMSGAWQVQVFVAVPGQQTASATFEITAR